MDRDTLAMFHRVAIHEMASGADREARRWAEECAQYYARRILALRCSGPLDSLLAASC